MDRSTTQCGNWTPYFLIVEHFSPSKKELNGKETTMKKFTLYDLPHSPYCSRVRIQIYTKQLDVDLVPPPGFKTEEYKQLNVTGKVPALKVTSEDDDNWILPESNAILNYLEEVFPEPSLLPESPMERAKTRLFMQFPDTYIAPSLFPLFQLLSADTKTDAELQAANNALFDQLSLLESLMERQAFKPGEKLTLADCSILPVLFFAKNVPTWLGCEDRSTALPAVSQWWDRANQHTAVAKTMGEIGEGLKSFLQ